MHTEQLVMLTGAGHKGTDSETCGRISIGGRMIMSANTYRGRRRELHFNMMEIRSLFAFDVEVVDLTSVVLVRH